jgi:hypothetical protein
MAPLEFLESWYLSQTNGEWEHNRGVTIETLDSPGWMVTVDLHETPLENRPMAPIRLDRSPRDWLACGVERKQFRGQGDPQKLHAILEIFQNWAAAASKVK